MTVKIKLVNSSGIDQVRFRGVHFSGYTFTFDVADGCMQPVNNDPNGDNLPNGDIGLTAFRVSDQKILDTLFYPVADHQGFAAHLIRDLDNPQEYRLVGEVFTIPD